MRSYIVVGCLTFTVIISCGKNVPYNNIEHPESSNITDMAQLSCSAESESDLKRSVPGERGDFSPQDMLFERLEVLGYADGTREAPRLHGVTIHDSTASFKGYNLYTSGHSPQATLMDMDGNILHQWHHDLWSVWPDLPKPKEPLRIFWRRVHVFENGDLLAIFGGVGIIKLDKDSNLLWENQNQAHHDLEVTDNGDIYLLTRSERIIPELNKKTPFVEDFLAILDSYGREKRRVSILKCFQNSPQYQHLWFQLARHGGDAFHTNTVFLLDDPSSPRIPAFRSGNILTSMRHLDVLAVIDTELENIVWAHHGSYRAQHDPQILTNGDLLLFDNGIDSLRSRILEFEPGKMQLVWSYEGTIDSPFYSELCGTCQRLPNGNTLITETDAGRAFEVTDDKRIVWEYYNPYRVGQDDTRIASLFEMERLPPDFPVHWTQSHRESIGQEP